jgi:cell wall-associated NlpC family hydrolase
MKTELRHSERARRVYLQLAVCCVVLLILSGCGGVHTAAPPRKPPVRQAVLVKMGYSIQVGAFSQVQNAANLSETLRQRHVNATYFQAGDGLYKVRFGNFRTRKAARIHALSLQKTKIIEDYYIVSPKQYSAARERTEGASVVRAEIVKTARSFIGIPYLWGGDSPETGFDCSGLVAACYHLNGLDLPRVSRDQFSVGTPIDRDELAPGDLVFFATNGEEISHVGIYVGGGRFIHAPGKGKTIREDALSGKYYEKRFRGGRSYLNEG